MGEKTEQKENETASPQNIKSKLNVLSEIVWTVSKMFSPKPFKIHACLYVSKAAPCGWAD